MLLCNFEWKNGKFNSLRRPALRNTGQKFIKMCGIIFLLIWIFWIFPCEWHFDGFDGGGCRWHPMPFRLENGYNWPSLARLVTDQSQWVLLLQNITLNCCFQSSLPILLSQVANLTCSSFRRELASSLHPRLHRHRTDFLSRSAKSGGTAGNLWHLPNYNDK